MKEALTADLVPAPLFKRYLAFAVDLGLVSGLLYGTSFLFIALCASTYGAWFGVNGLLEFPQNGLETVGIVGVLLFVVVLLGISFVAFDGYFVWFEFQRGTTPGKRLFGMRVVSLRGAPLTLGQCFLREAFRLLDCFLILPGIVSVASSARRQRLGDLAAGVMVVYSAAEEAGDGFYRPSALRMGGRGTAGHAGFAVRSLALLVDALVVSAVRWPLTLLLLPFTMAGGSVAIAVQILDAVFGVAIAFVYWGGFYKHRGATPGKMLFGLKVVDSRTGNFLGYGQTFLREIVGKSVSALLLGFGFLLPFVRDDRRALHDLFVNTDVIRRDEEIDALSRAA